MTEQHRFKKQEIIVNDMEQVKQMWIHQRGICPICETTFTTTVDMHVDHTTKQIRNLLCNR
jgi:hypothetical protein